MSDFWLGVAGAFLGSTLGVLGADAVKFRLEPGKRLEKRRDEHLLRMLSVVDDIERTGASYWNGEYLSNSKEIKATEQAIKAGLLVLSRDINDLFWDHHEYRKVCDVELRALRSVVTGGDFGDSQEMQEPTAVLETRTKAHDLKRSLRINRDKLPRQFL